MTGLDLSSWVPRGVEERSGAFARVVVARADPPSWARARSLLWAASRLCECALVWGLAPEPSVLLADAVIERFIITGTAGWSASCSSHRALEPVVLGPSVLRIGTRADAARP
jgi:hypothetical protein